MNFEKLKQKLEENGFLPNPSLSQIKECFDSDGECEQNRLSKEVIRLHGEIYRMRMEEIERMKLPTSVEPAPRVSCPPTVEQKKACGEWFRRNYTSGFVKTQISPSVKNELGESWKQTANALAKGCGSDLPYPDTAMSIQHDDKQNDKSETFKKELEAEGFVNATERDNVNHPQHYTQHPSGVECIEVTEHMNFCLGNAMKYLWRADLKNGNEDLKKARWYIDREIERRGKCSEASAVEPFTYNFSGSELLQGLDGTYIKTPDGKLERFTEEGFKEMMKYACRRVK